MRCSYRRKGKRARGGNRDRNITWFNPPYSIYIDLNVGDLFISAVERCLASNPLLTKILNKNTMKVSYICGPNIESIISTHNKKVLMETEEGPSTHRKWENRRKGAKRRDLGKCCNCTKFDCPVGGRCLTTNVVYGAKVQELNVEGRAIGELMRYV